MIRIFVLALCFLIFPVDSFSADSLVKNQDSELNQKFERMNELLKKDQQKPIALVEKSVGKIALEMSLALIVVLLLLFVVVFLFRKLQKAKINAEGGLKKMRAIDSLHLGSGQRLVAVDIQGKVMILGVTQNQVNPVLELSEENSKTFLSDDGVTPIQFSETVNHFLERFRKPEKNLPKKGNDV